MDDTKKALLSIDIDTAALTQNVNNAKAAVADLAAQLKELKASGKDSGEAFDKLSEQLKKAGEEAKKSNDALKEHTRGLSDSTAAANNLKGGLIDLSKQHNSLQGDTAKSTKSVSDYTNSFLKAVESVTPFGKSISETAEKFKTFQEGAGKVGSALGLLKKDGDAAATNALTLSTNAGNATKGFEALKTGTDVASSGVSGFSKALAATGIGLVIIAVSALMDYLKQFTPLVDAVERVTAGLSGGFTALGRIVMDLLSPLKKLFTDPKQAMVDLVNFLEQNVINRFKAFGVILDAITHGNLKQFADGVIQLGTGITNATDKITGYGKAIVKAGVDTANLKGEQQELARSVAGEALKAAETEAKIAEQRVKAQTGNLAQRKAALAEIAKLEADQAKLHKDNIDKGLDLAVKDVAIKRALTQQEINDIKTKGAAELEELEKAGRIYADDVKALSDALGKKAELRKEDTAKLVKQNQDSEAKAQQHEQKMQEIRNAARTAEQERQASAERVKLGAIQDDLLRERTAIEDDFKQRIKAAGENSKLGIQLKQEQNQKLAAIDEQIKQRDLKDQKELFDLRQEEAIKLAEKNGQDTYKLKVEQAQKDLEFDLKNINLTEKEKLILKEKFNQKLNELNEQRDKQSNKSDDESSTQHSQVIKKTAEAEEKILLQKAQTYTSYYTKIANLFGKHTAATKAAFIAQKAIAVAEIVLSTQKQIAAINEATAKKLATDAGLGLFGIPKAIIDKVEGIIEVVAAIASGAKQVGDINSTNPAGFARGGMYLSDSYGAYITGPGSGTSDSINAKLSNGEAVINARSTAMFAPILSAINIAGGGRAFKSSVNGNGYALGGLFNGSNTLNDGSNDLATARATNDMVKTIAANMPRQILVVEDVQASLQNKVMLQNMSNF